eukprot:COSAG01_NODE_51200_length_356_cov_3.521401_1_plen_69_part_10
MVIMGVPSESLGESLSESVGESLGESLIESLIESRMRVGRQQATPRANLGIDRIKPRVRPSSPKPDESI